MKVRIFNRTNSVQYLDINGDGNPDTVYALGPNSNNIIELPSEMKFVELSTKYRGKLVLRKLS